MGCLLYDFVVEDGTGLPTATSYLGTFQADDFAEFWGYSDWSALPEDDKESLLIKASRILDEKFEWNSHILKRDQGLLWPRHPFRDSEGRDVEGLPKDIVEATAEIAILLQHYSISDLDEVKYLTSQSYGSSSETYAGSWAEGISPLAAKFNQIAARLKRFRLGGKSIQTVRLRRG